MVLELIKAYHAHRHHLELAARGRAIYAKYAITHQVCTRVYADDYVVGVIAGWSRHQWG